MGDEYFQLLQLIFCAQFVITFQSRVPWEAESYSASQIPERKDCKKKYVFILYFL